MNKYFYVFSALFSEFGIIYENTEYETYVLTYRYPCDVKD